jgi:hypothetical protein
MKIEGNKIILSFKKGTDNLQPTSDVKAFL